MITLCCIGSQVDGELDLTPHNTAVLDGQSAVLRCHSLRRSDFGLRWNRRLVGRTYDETVVYTTYRRKSSGYEDVVIMKLTLSSVYSLISDGQGQFDLVVNRTNTSITGLYTCRDRDDWLRPARAYLTIIGQLIIMLLGGLVADLQGGLQGGRGALLPWEPKKLCYYVLLLIPSQGGFTRCRCPSVCLYVCLSVSLLPRVSLNVSSPMKLIRTSINAPRFLHAVLVNPVTLSET